MEPMGAHLLSFILPLIGRIFQEFAYSDQRRGRFLKNLFAAKAKIIILVVILKTMNYASLQRIRISKFKGTVQGGR